MKLKQEPKNGHFIKGLVHGFCPKIELFLIAFFHSNYVRKNHFWILQKENIHFKTKKLKFSQGPKNGHFLKGLVHGFIPKTELFLIGTFHRNSIRTQRFLYCGKKRKIFTGKNCSSKKDQKWTFSKGVSPWILSKNQIFLCGCFLQKLCQKKWFLIILDRKQTL